MVRYLEFWQEHPDWIRQVKEEQFDELLDLLRSNGLLRETDRDEFDSEFVDTNRSTVNVCPGVSLHFRWGKSEALDLDASDGLVEEIDGCVREAVRTWGAEAKWESALEEEA